MHVEKLILDEPPDNVIDAWAHFESGDPWMLFQHRKTGETKWLRCLKCSFVNGKLMLIFEVE